MNILAPESRICRRCNTERPLREFPRRRIKGGHRQMSCVFCVVPRRTSPGSLPRIIPAGCSASVIGTQGNGSATTLFADVVALLLTILRGAR